MATPFTDSALALNPVEQEDAKKFIYELLWQQPELAKNHAIYAGVKMKEQIVFASAINKAGIKDTGTSRPNSGAKSVLTQTYVEPQNIGDTMIYTPIEINALLKAQRNTLTKYTDQYNMNGSLEKLLVVDQLLGAAKLSMNKLIWLGQKNIAVSGAAAAGLKAAGDVKYYDAIDGIWYKAYAAVTAATLSRFTITKNAALSFALQALAADEALTIFEGVWAKADPRLKSDPSKVMFVTNTIFENYRQSLQTKGTPYDVTLTTDGFRELKWNGTTIRNMETLWDLHIQGDFEQLNTGLAYDKPHRVLLTVPANIPVATLNNGDIDSVESFVDPITRNHYMAFGFTLDALLLEGYMAVAAY
jgi:hypothetical protein